eukprot:c11249_g2_i2.p2 GENE.c11249_g2_i2~~c11249_g2_i2.p2  ORF type:complete len:135 (-),score=28.41 c11249_g2_i2:84-488(-)
MQCVWGVLCCVYLCVCVCACTSRECILVLCFWVVCSEYFMPRYTKNSVTFYVNTDFDSKFPDFKSVASVERRVESDYKQLLQKRCQSEKLQQRRLDELVDVDDTKCDKTCRQQKAQDFEMESCELLQTKFGIVA